MMVGSLKALGFALLVATASGGCGDDGDTSGTGASNGGGGGATGGGGAGANAGAGGGTGGGTGGGGAGTGGTAGGPSGLAAGLIHAYKFEQADVLLDHVGTADATLVTVTAFDQPGNADGAWELAATNEDYIALAPGMLDGLTAITVCVWAQRASGSVNGGLFSWRGEPQGGALLVQSDGLEWDLNTSVTGGFGSFDAGAWHLACGQVRDSSLEGLEIYFDGVKLEDDPGQSLIANNGTNPEVVIGADASFFSTQLNNHFSGLIDEVYVWNRGLSGDEHVALYALAGASFW